MKGFMKLRKKRIKKAFARNLREVLRKERAEARKMSIYEYDYEKHMKMEREQHFAEGLAQGKNEESRENARRLFENGVSYNIVRNSIPGLPEQELKKIYEAIVKKV